LAGFWDVTGRNHVLSLRARVEMLESTGADPVPLTERLQIGGSEYLRGVLGGRYRGDSTIVLSAQYRYPIWSMLDASLFVEVGNAFLGRFEEFSLRNLMLSWGFALRTNTSRDVSFDIMIGFGTNPFHNWDGNFEVDSIRFTFGVNQGF
jgi:outer membrane protein assembly factor BamA